MDRPQATRRDFLSGMVAGTGLIEGCSPSVQPSNTPEAPAGPADVTLRIGNVPVDIAKDHTISTIGYNGTVPGPPIRLREGVPVTVDLFNETDTPELVHWHGQIIPTNVDGALEEKSLVVPKSGKGPRRKRKPKNPMDGKSGISGSRSMESAWASANRCGVKPGQRVLFHVLNASATENIKLALPGHRFQVVALDGNLMANRPEAC